MKHEKKFCGFEWGAATITRLSADDKAGWVILGLSTPKETMQLYVTKTGKVRVFSEGAGEWQKPKEKDAGEISKKSGEPSG